MREGVARPQIELLSRLVPKSYFEERIIYGRGIFWIGFRLGEGGVSTVRPGQAFGPARGR
jgi:hypothetical protein